MGYNHVWLLTPEDSPSQMRIRSLSPNPIHEANPVISITGDLVIAELLLKDQPVVVQNAIQDPRTDNAAVRTLQLVTLISIPIHLSEGDVAILCVATFGDEGEVLPTTGMLDYLQGMAAPIGSVLDRLQLKESQRISTLQLTKIQMMENVGLTASNLVHEFNNMLQIITMNITNAQRHCIDPEAIKDLDIALEFANRIRILSRQLLSVGRGEEAMQMRVLQLNDEVTYATNIITKVLPNLVITTSLEAGLPSFIGSSDHLFQVVLNLAINSRDAIPADRQGTFTLSTSLQGDELLLAVSDNGSGIDPAIRERIFEPFFSTKPYLAGSGLGLAVIQGIIENHDGRIECLTQVGVGTTFNLYFPIHSMV